MARLVNSAFTLLIGVLLGWWLHGQLAPTGPLELSASARDSTSSRGGAVAERAPVVSQVSAAPSSVNSVTDAEDAVRHFRRLLERRDYDEAMVFYESTLQLSAHYQVLLKPVLDNYLKTCLGQCGEGAFIALVDAWLANYYDDIPVLLLLAEYQRRHGFVH